MSLQVVYIIGLIYTNEYDLFCNIMFLIDANSQGVMINLVANVYSFYYVL